MTLRSHYPIAAPRLWLAQSSYVFPGAKLGKSKDAYQLLSNRPEVNQSPKYQRWARSAKYPAPGLARRDKVQRALPNFPPEASAVEQPVPARLGGPWWDAVAQSEARAGAARNQADNSVIPWRK